LERAVSHPAGEVVGLAGISLLLYQPLGRPQEAIIQMEQAIAVLQARGLPQDAAGNTAEDLQRILQIMRTGNPLGGQEESASTMLDVPVQQIISTTVAVMTTVQDRRAEWREIIEKVLHDAQESGADWQSDVDFISAVLAMLDGKVPAFLPADHPYAQAVAAIQSGIAAGDSPAIEGAAEIVQAIRAFINTQDWDALRQVLEAKQALLFQPEVEQIFEQNIKQAQAAGDERAVGLLEQHLAILRGCKQRGIAETFAQFNDAGEDVLPFDAKLIPRSIAALLGSPQEKMALVQYLVTLSSQTTDAELKVLLNGIQVALFGGDLSQPGQHLSGVYLQAWEAFIVGVETEGVDPHIFDMLVRDTTTVLGPAKEQQDEWRENLIQMKEQAAAQGVMQLVALLEAIIGLLDAAGNPSGLGTGLTGIFAGTWHTIVAHLPPQQGESPLS
jgi:hypothetical protein